MLMRTSCFVSLVAFFLYCSAAFAANAPTDGIVHNVKEVSSLTYSCKSRSDGTLACEFVQASVRRKAKPEDLELKLKEGREEFKTGTKIDEEECNGYKLLLDVLEGRKRAPKADALSEMSELQKKDSLEIGKALVSYCATKSESDFLKLIRLGHDKDVRSCSVSTFKYEQNFKAVQSKAERIDSWVAQGTPEGACGIVQLSRFEYESRGSNFGFWKYYARKAITNPEGDFFPGASCKGLDEGEYLYDWRSKEHSLRCDYVTFSPL